jgi:hypothetical protein
MVRMKLSKEEFDPKALDVKVEPSTFKRYRGEIPPNGTILIVRVTKMWWTQSRAGDSQIYLMAFAEQNTGSLKKYNGLPIRERLTFIPDAAFRYMNFLNNFGLTTQDIFNKMDVERDPDQIGDIINSIADWVVGSDDALCRVALIRDRYDPDELKAKVDRDGWLPLVDEDELDEDEDEDEDEDIDEYEEDEEPPARPTRASGRTSRTRASASTPRRRAEPEPNEDEDEEEEEPARPTRGVARTRQAKPSSRGRQAEPEEDEDENDEYEDEDIDDEAEEAEEEEPEDEEAEEEPPARPSRGSRTGRTTARNRPAATGRRAPATSGRRDGERTRTSARTSTIRTERTPGPRGSKGRDGGSREDPPF